MIEKSNLFCYKISKVIKVLDGDTIDVMVDLGFNIHIKSRIRLVGINCPETRTRDLEEKKRGLAAKERMQAFCETQEGEYLILKSHGVGKYGRVLGEIQKNGAIINNILLAEGHAKKYDD